MDGGQLDGAVVKAELSDLPLRSRSRSPLVRPRNVRERPRSVSRSRSRSRSQSQSRPGIEPRSGESQPVVAASGPSNSKAIRRNQRHGSGIDH